MKTISVVIPTYNEEGNIPLVYRRVKDLFAEKLPDYQLLIQFIDNASTDRSRILIRALAQSDPCVRAIFNARNFGFTRSTFYGLSQAEGDCAIMLYADMQDPPEVIPEFVKAWENGGKVVLGIKTQSKESRLLYWIRRQYYKLIRRISEIDHIEQFDGFGLYDRTFLNVLLSLDDSLPYLRGIVAELGFQRVTVNYTQDVRKHGKSSFSFFKLYDQAMLGITSYSKIVMRMATLLGAAVSCVSILVTLFTLIYKLLHWDSFPVGMAAVSIGVFFFGAIQLFFIGLLGEYILSINTRVLHHPLVIEETRLNFTAVDKPQELCAEPSEA